MHLEPEEAIILNFSKWHSEVSKKYEKIILRGNDIYHKHTKSQSINKKTKSDKI
jgi:hypothetical protein